MAKGVSIGTHNRIGCEIFIAKACPTNGYGTFTRLNKALVELELTTWTHSRHC